METELKTTKRNIPASLAHLKGTYDRAVIAHASHGRQLNAYNMEVAKRKAMTARNVEAITDPKRRDEMSKLYESEFADWLKGYRSETSESRWKDAGELNTLRADAIEAKAILTNPVALATVHGFGTPERNAMATEVNGLGPHAMRNLATVAIRTGNKAMIGALVVANDKLPRGDRPFSSQEIATAGFGEEAEQAAKLIAIIDRLHAESIAAVRQTEGNPLTPNEKLSHGLKFGPGRAVPVSPTVLSKPKTTTSKISSGLSAQ
ncbi:hypothetical protein [Aestuariivirga sp.]|uniref:hypothetical protein n=1 Tax=Aestuariivirga sp. TaxID=2650926 RepID=UPI0035944C3E